MSPVLAVYAETQKHSGEASEEPEDNHEAWSIVIARVEVPSRKTGGRAGLRSGGRRPGWWSRKLLRLLRYPVLNSLP